MKDGFVLIDKPAGPTSHDIVTQVRRALDARKAGHAGTLDPFATGLLIVLLNRATRLFNYVLGLEKSYEGTIRLGETSDTDDVTGDVTSTGSDVSVIDADQILEAMKLLEGRYEQSPPRYSAKKVRGQPAHRRVRRGEEVHLETQLVEVSSFRPTTVDGPDVSFHAVVSSGTYVRALARDLGQRLSCGAYLRSLRRLCVGPFDVADAIDVVNVQPADVRPLGDLVPHISRVTVDDDGRRALCQGRPFPAAVAPGTETTAVFHDSELVAMAEVRGGVLHPRVVLVGE